MLNDDEFKKIVLEKLFAIHEKIGILEGTSGGGGGAGGCLKALIPSPSASYVFNVGAKGAAGIGGSNGGNAADGKIKVWEYRQ